MYDAVDRAPWTVGGRASDRIHIARSRRHGSSESTISTRCPRVVRHTSHDAPPCALGHPATLPDARWGRPRPSTDHAASLVRSGSRPACSADARARTGAGQRHAAEQTARATHVTLQRDVTVLKAFRTRVTEKPRGSCARPRTTGSGSIGIARLLASKTKKVIGRGSGTSSSTGEGGVAPSPGRSVSK